jgi:hypothetical protein
MSLGTLADYIADMERAYGQPGPGPKSVGCGPMNSAAPGSLSCRRHRQQKDEEHG